MNKISKSSFDLSHFSMMGFLGLTSWAALFLGLLHQFGPVFAIGAMALVNIIFDFFPFVLGCEVSERLEKGEDWRKVKWIIFMAICLHFVSACITFFGAPIGASMIVTDDSIEQEIASADEQKASIDAENKSRQKTFDLAVAAEKARRDKLISEQTAALEKQVKELANQSWAVRDSTGNKERVRIARQVQKLQDAHEKWKKGILDQPIDIAPPVMLEVPEGVAAALDRADELKAKQDNIKTALIITDIALFLSTILWFVVLVFLPELGGKSMLLNVIGLIPYSFRALGIGVGRLVENLEWKIENARTPREKKLLDEINDLMISISTMREKIHSITQEKRVQETSLSNLRSQMDLLIRENEARMSENEKASELSDSLRRALNEKESKFYSATQELDSLRKKVSDLTQSLIQEKERHSQTSEALALIERAERVRQENERVKNEQEAARKLEQPSGLSGEMSEKKSEKERIRARKRAIWDDPIEWEGVEYKSFESFYGAMRSAKKTNPERYLRMKAHYNKLLGINSEIRRLG